MIPNPWAFPSRPLLATGVTESQEECSQGTFPYVFRQITSMRKHVMVDGDYKTRRDRDGFHRVAVIVIRALD